MNIDYLLAMLASASLLYSIAATLGLLHFVRLYRSAVDELPKHKPPPPELFPFDSADQRLAVLKILYFTKDISLSVSEISLVADFIHRYIIRP